MYTDIVVRTSEGYLKSYTVTDNNVISNGYVPTGVRFYKRDTDWYAPVEHKDEYIIRRGDVKDSIYKRRWLSCKADRYDYAFTEKTTKTITTNKDVYYNEDRDSFITKSRTSTKTRTEYDIPRLIVF